MQTSHAAQIPSNSQAVWPCHCHDNIHISSSNPDLSWRTIGIKKLHSKHGHPATSELTHLLYKEDFTANRRFQINSLLSSSYQERDAAGKLCSGMHSKNSFAQQKQTNTKGVKTDRPPAGHCCPPLCGDPIPWSVTCSEGVSGSGG